MSTHEIERRSLACAKWANLVMGTAGIVAAIASNASALMLDGLFSGVNFLATLFATRVAASIQRKPDAVRPFGYEIDEPIYVMFRSLVLTGIIIVAGFIAIDKIVAYISGVDIAPVKLDWVVGYMILMLTICFALAVWHHYHWVKTQRQSELLKAERSAALIDGVLSAAAGAAFIAIAFMKDTPLSFLVPISDAIVVLGLVLYMIPKPVAMFTQALREVTGESAEPQIVANLHSAVHQELVGKPFDLLQLATTRTGRSLFALAYIRPEQPASATALDSLKDAVLHACQTVHPLLRMEIIFTGRTPY